MHKTTIEFAPGFLLTLCFACLIIPLKFLFAWITAVAFHEAAHCFVLLLGKIEIYRFKAKFFGAVISTAPISPQLELVCAAAGPLASLALLIFIRYWPLLSICGVLQALYNLLPLYPSDGWRILNSLVISIGFSNRICSLIEILTLIILTVFTCILTFQLHFGAAPFIALMFLFIKQKYSCKQRRKRVQ